MSQVKTAISIEAGIFKELNKIAHKIHTSRSRIFEIAAKDWLKGRQKEQLVQQINKAIERDRMDTSDKRRLEYMKAQHRKLVEGEW